jgi:alkylation response protein AidB-like acyl-CoA dehydrogenase
VTTPKGFKEAYKQYVEGGWAALACDPEYGGQGLPVVMNNSFYEMLNSANQAWTMYPGLSHGAYECLKEHGTDEQKNLPAEAGVGRMDRHHVPDRAALRHRPGHAALESAATGRRLVADHRQQDLHLGRRTRHVGKHRAPGAGPRAGRTGRLERHLAVPGAEVPAECRRLIGERNPIFCGAIEEKMGIHGNSTCQMNLDGAKAGSSASRTKA